MARDFAANQGNPGHTAAAFTPDVYGHVPEQMKQAGAQRMEAYSKRVLDPERENALKRPAKKPCTHWGTRLFRWRRRRDLNYWVRVKWCATWCV